MSKKGEEVSNKMQIYKRAIEAVVNSIEECGMRVISIDICRSIVDDNPRAVVNVKLI